MFDTFFAAFAKPVRYLKAVVALSILVPTATFAVTAWQDRNQVLLTAERAARHTTDILEQHALNVFETHELVAARINDRIRNSSWDEIGASETLHHFLETIAGNYPQILAIWLIDGAGTLRNASRTFPSPPISLADRDYFVALRETDLGTFISQMVRGRLFGDVSFSVVRRRETATGAFDGLIALTVSPMYFIDFWRRVAPPHNLVAGLVRKDGIVLMREPGLFAEAALPSDGALMQAMRAGDQGIFRGASTQDGIERIYGFRKVGAYDAYVVYSIGIGAVLKEWQAHLIVNGSLFVVGTFVLFLAAFAALCQAQHSELVGCLAAQEMNRRVAAEEQLRQSHKMEILGQLTGGMAHDFNNLLAAAMINVESLRMREGNPRRAEIAEQAAEAIRQAMQVVQSLLAFARRQPLRMEIFDLNRCIRGIEGLLRQSLGSSVQLRVHFAAPTCMVKANKQQTTMAVLNLVLNAHDAMPKGGELRIETANVDLQGERDGVTGEFAALTIADNGSGMSREVLAHAVEPFFTTKEAGKGTGLGLSMVYGFAKQSGGTITIRSEVDKGTTVTIYLPRGTESREMSTGSAELTVVGQ